MEATLIEVALKLQFDLLAYCFMPDHLHVLLRGREADSDLLGFVQRFKQITSFHFKRDTGEAPWQQSFYDHVLHGDEDVGVVASYIFENPSRAGLPKGSLAYDLRGGDLFERGVEPDGLSLHRALDGAKGPDRSSRRTAND
jgi:putative transposase